MFSAMSVLLMVAGLICMPAGILVAQGSATPGLVIVLIGAVFFVGGAVVSEIRQLKVPQ